MIHMYRGKPVISGPITPYNDTEIKEQIKNKIDISKLNSEQFNISEDGTISIIGGTGTIPIASKETLGGIKVGNTLNIENGVLDIKDLEIQYITLENYNQIENKNNNITYFIEDTDVL